MSTAPSNESRNFLGSEVELKGILKFAAQLTFDGKIDGDIISSGALGLGENAVVRGNLEVNSVVIHGKVTGNITAREKIELKAKAEVFGDVRAPRLVMEEGVTFVGQTMVNPNKSSAAETSAQTAGLATKATAAEPRPRS
jgi:cytoskeletal protein CcmA (bactofilin family)